MDQRQEAMNQKQDLILQYLTPKALASADTPSIAGSVASYDVAKGTAATASGAEKSSTTATVEKEHKLKGSSSKRSSTVSSGSGSSGEDDE